MGGARAPARRRGSVASGAGCDQIGDATTTGKCGGSRGDRRAAFAKCDHADDATNGGAQGRAPPITLSRALSLPRKKLTRSPAASRGAALVALPPPAPGRDGDGHRPTGPSFGGVSTRPRTRRRRAANVKTATSVRREPRIGAGTGYQRVRGAARLQGAGRGHDDRSTDATSPTPDLDFTAFVVGKRTTNGGAGVVAIMLPDDNAAPAAGQIKMRFVNGAEAAPSVDVYVTAPAASILTATPNVSALAYRAGSSYLALAAARTGASRRRARDGSSWTSPRPRHRPADPGRPRPPALAAAKIRTIVI